MLDLDMASNDWVKKNIRNIGIDGVSERLRKMVNKPISKALLNEFIDKKIIMGNGGQVKFYCVVGYPTESDDDYLELLNNIRGAEERTKGKAGNKFPFLFAPTPFRAMPATPAALWPMSTRDFRKRSISGALKSSGNPGNVFFQGEHIWAVEWMGTDSVYSVYLDAIALRGVESDSDNVAKISRSKKFHTASGNSKRATLEAVFDIKKLMGGFNLDNYPVNYLHGYLDNSKIMREAG